MVRPEEGRTEPEERVLPLERVALLPELMATLESGQETRVRQGQWIGSRQEGKAKL